MNSLPQLLLVGLGGGVGSILRFGLSRWITNGAMPWGTIVTNIVGSLVMGWVMAKTGPTEADHAQWQAFLALGFCGGFTTFSSFSWQTFEQLRHGQVGLALAHVLLSVSLCLLAVWGGWKLGRI
jgi:CrcB protein